MLLHNLNMYVNDFFLKMNVGNSIFYESFRKNGFHFSGEGFALIKLTNINRNRERASAG